MIKMSSNTDKCSKIRKEGSVPHPEAYDNLEVLLKGYNIYKGSPFAQNDYGFGNKLFEFDWSNPNLDTNEKYFPSETDVLRVSKCSADTVTEVT